VKINPIDATAAGRNKFFPDDIIISNPISAYALPVVVLIVDRLPDASIQTRRSPINNVR
jgi:hypothetical protein